MYSNGVRAIPCLLSPFDASLPRGCGWQPALIRNLNVCALLITLTASRTLQACPLGPLTRVLGHLIAEQHDGAQPHEWSDLQSHGLNRDGQGETL